MSPRAGTPGSPLRRLPSDEWLLVPLHWHAYTRPAPPDRAPEEALYDPFAVATWLAERTAAHLWQQHLLIASRGDSVRHNELVVHAVLNQKCGHGCMAGHAPPTLATRRAPTPRTPDMDRGLR